MVRLVESIQGVLSGIRNIIDREYIKVIKVYTVEAVSMSNITMFCLDPEFSCGDYKRLIKPS